MPFRVFIYQPLTLLGIVNNLGQKLNIQFAKHLTLINLFLKFQ